MWMSPFHYQHVPMLQFSCCCPVCTINHAAVMHIAFWCSHSVLLTMLPSHQNYCPMTLYCPRTKLLSPGYNIVTMLSSHHQIIVSSTCYPLFPMLPSHTHVTISSRPHSNVSSPCYHLAPTLSFHMFLPSMHTPIQADITTTRPFIAAVNAALPSMLLFQILSCFSAHWSCCLDHTPSQCCCQHCPPTICPHTTSYHTCITMSYQHYHQFLTLSHSHTTVLSPHCLIHSNTITKKEQKQQPALPLDPIMPIKWKIVWRKNLSTLTSANNKIIMILSLNFNTTEIKKSWQSIPHVNKYKMLATY